ncbi:MAG: aldehyde dehydrogenase [Salinirussus sp.]
MFETTLESLSGIQVPLEIEDRMYVDGEFVGAAETFGTEHPPTGEVLAEVPIAGPDEIDDAVRAGARASEKWRQYDVFERREVLEAFADFLEAHEEALTNIDVADNGSSISRMKFDVEKGARNIRYMAGISHELKGESPPTGPDTHDFTIREPFGVVAGIVPFNHPNMFVSEKLAPALAAGNGIVIKPSEYTPLSALYIGHLIDSFGRFPEGLVNVVTGFGETGAELVGHPGVGLISMVGGPETGKAIMRGAADHLAPVLLELGGKNPFVVFPDADMDAVVDGLEGAMALPWEGQSCGSGTRLLIHEDAYDAVVPAIVDRVESVTVGDPFDESNTMGSIVSEPQFEKVTGYVEQAIEEGAELLAGGEVVDDYETGYFLRPTVFRATPENVIANQETFGPVLTVLPWSDYDEMIGIANGVDYGLTASVWTNDLNTAHSAVGDIEAGYVWVNQHGRHYIGAPFGGYKESGIRGKEDLQELLDHTRVKNVNIDFSGDSPTLAGGND